MTLTGLPMYVFWERMGLGERARAWSNANICAALVWRSRRWVVAFAMGQHARLGQASPVWARSSCAPSAPRTRCAMRSYDSGQCPCNGKLSNQDYIKLCTVYVIVSA